MVDSGTSMGPGWLTVTWVPASAVVGATSGRTATAAIRATVPPSAAQSGGHSFAATCCVTKVVNFAISAVSSGSPPS